MIGIRIYTYYQYIVQPKAWLISCAAIYQHEKINTLGFQIEDKHSTILFFINWGKNVQFMFTLKVYVRSF